MKRALTAARVLLGLIFVVFGFDGLFHFVPMPPMPEAAAAFIHELISTRLFYAVKAIEIGCGLLLLSGRYVTVAICLLAPVIFNIVWFDAALAPSALPMGALLVLLELTLVWNRRAALAPLFAAASDHRAAGTKAP